MTIIEKMLMKINPKAVIKRSSFFDEEWYKEKYGISKDAAKHYLDEGWILNYNPSIRFSSRDYLINNPDIKGINPLLHYEVFGKDEGRRPFAPAREISGDYVVEKSMIPYEEIYREIETKEIISFDVFDTLVIRPFIKAEDLFDYMEQKCSAYGFSSARKKAEYDARNELKKEVTIDEIYRYIDGKYASLKEKEIESEILFCHTNPLIRPIYEKAKQKNKRVIAISDMYLPASVIRMILENSHYVMDDIYVSCDCNKTKGSGELYRSVLMKENVSSDKMIHLGDNYISDYSEAVNSGITAYQTTKIIDMVLSQERYKPLLMFLNSHDSLSSSTYLAQACEYLSTIKEEPFFTKLGYILGGPLALSYLDFICQEAKKDEIDEFLFVARDGCILKELYKKLFFEKYHIPFAYAYLSRASIYSAALKNMLTSDLNTIFSIARSYFLDIPIHDDPEELLRFYESHRNEIDAWSEEQDANLKDHLRKISDKYEKIAVIDMFSGNFTSQKGAEHYLSNKRIKAYYAGNFADSDLDHVSFAKRILGMRDNLPVKMSEFLISSYESPIVGVDEKGDPIYEFEQSELKTIRYKQILAGIERFIEDHRIFFSDGMCTMPLEEWLELADCYLKNCCEKEIEEFEVIIDSENPVSKDCDKSIAELIRSYREKGY